MSAPTHPRTAAHARPAGALAASTLCEAFHITATTRADEIAVRTEGNRVAISWAEYARRVRRIAEGLHALGLRHGDPVALLLSKCLEFHLVDAAALHLGAVPFSIYDVYAPAQVGALIADSRTRIVVTDTRLAPTISDADVGHLLDHVVVVNGMGALSLADLERRRSSGFDFEATWRAVAPDDLATLIYTSGTTGAPKAIELTHGALLRGWRSLQTAWQLEPGGRVISYGSSAHISDRCTAHYGSMVLGLTITCAPGAPAAIGLLPEVRPSVFFAVPPAWEAVRARVEALVNAAGEDQRRAFDDAVERSRQVLAAERRGEPVSAEERAELARTDAQVLAPVRDRIGLASTLGLVGGAPSPTGLIDFFQALGVRLGETYGMSEFTTLVTFDPRDPVRPGTVGRPLPEVELRVDDAGEILVRTDAVMRGYRDRPDATAEVLDPDGWLHTGDLGALDPDGYLQLVGRKKELIVNVAGHNMSPSMIEATVKAESPPATDRPRRPLRWSLVDNEVATLRPRIDHAAAAPRHDQQHGAVTGDHAIDHRDSDSDDVAPRAGPCRHTREVAVLEPDLLTLQQVADRLQVSRWSVYQLIWSGRLPSVHLGRCHRVRARDFEAYLDRLGRDVA